jgi:hypothetical protein
MSGVEALEQPSIAEATPVTDADLEAIWNRDNVTNGADRGEGGKFVSANAEPSTELEPEQVAEPVTEPASLEGETGEEQPGSTPADVPLPPNWAGKEAVWSAIPAEHRPAIAQHQQELHSRLSDMGRQVSTYKPLQEAASEFAEYFNGNLKGSDGQPINPADGIRYLANIQRSMDKQPLETLLSIADTYNLREQLAKTFGGQVQSVPQDTKILLNEIAELKQALKARNPSAEIEQVIEARELKSEARRLQDSEPLFKEIKPERWDFFVKEGVQTLGENASVEAVFKYAVNAAVEADPALRAKAQAAKAANTGTQLKTEAAKRATSVNVTSTSSGKARQPSLDDELAAVWEKNHKG